MQRSRNELTAKEQKRNKVCWILPMCGVVLFDHRQHTRNLDRRPRIRARYGDPLRVQAGGRVEDLAPVAAEHLASRHTRPGET